MFVAIALPLVGALGDFIEKIENGTTCFAEPGGYFMDEVAPAMKEVVKGVAGRGIRDRRTLWNKAQS